jgi:hypothetical protein
MLAVQFPHSIHTMALVEVVHQQREAWELALDHLAMEAMGLPIQSAVRLLVRMFLARCMSVVVEEVGKDHLVIVLRFLAQEEMEEEVEVDGEDLVKMLEHLVQQILEGERVALFMQML